MPVRIYDISKKLGLEKKEVLSKAKELGLAAARVASSSLDKITAEYLEQQLILDHPGLASAAPPPVVTPPQVHEPIVVTTAPPPEALSVEEQEQPAPEVTTDVLEPEPQNPAVVATESETLAEAAQQV